MALRFIDGFETYTTVGQRWGGTGSSIGAGRLGSGMGTSQWANGAGPRALLPVAMTTVITGIAWQAPPSVTWDGNYILAFWEGPSTTFHGGLQHNASSKLDYRRGDGTLLASGTTIFGGSVWRYLELKVVIHNSAGSVELRVNGVTEFSVSGIDTRNGGAVGNIETFGFGEYNSSVWDDLYICDDTGSVNNDFLGDIRVSAVFPTGAGNSTQFTPSAGSNWQNVDDAAPNDDTDYNSSSTVGQKDTFDAGNMPTNATVLGVQLVNRWRKDDAGSRTARSIIRSSGTDYEGSDVTLSNTYTDNLRVAEVNPATSALWTPSEVNGAEIGYKIEA